MYNADATFNISTNNTNTPEASPRENATDEVNQDVSYAQSLSEMYDEQDHNMEVYRTACTNFWCPWCELWIPDYHSRMVHLEQYHGGEMPPLNASLSRRPPSISSPYYHMLVSTPSLPPPPPNSPVLAPIIDETDIDLEMEAMQWVNWDGEKDDEEANLGDTFSHTESSATAAIREENMLGTRVDFQAQVPSAPPSFPDANSISGSTASHSWSSMPTGVLVSSSSPASTSAHAPSSQTPDDTFPSGASQIHEAPLSFAIPAQTIAEAMPISAPRAHQLEHLPPVVDLTPMHNVSAAAAAEAAAATLLSLPSATVESAIAQIQQPPYWVVRGNAATQDDSMPLEMTSTEMVAAAAAAITTARAVTAALVHGNSYDPTSIRFSAQHSTPATYSAASAQYAPLATSGNVDVNAPSSITRETGRWEKWEKRDRRRGGR